MIPLRREYGLACSMTPTALPSAIRFWRVLLLGWLMAMPPSRRREVRRIPCCLPVVAAAVFIGHR